MPSDYWVLITPVIIILSVLLTMFGRGLLANWLGLTRTSANRLITILVIALWVLLLIVRVDFSNGSFELSRYGRAIFKSWWVIAFLAVWVVTMFRKKLH